MKENYTKMSSSNDEEQYLSKNQLGLELGSSILLNAKWKKILQERAQYKTELSVLNGLRNPYFYTSNGYITEQIKKADETLETYKNLFNDVTSDECLSKLKTEVLVYQLRALNSSINAKWSDNAILAVCIEKYDRSDIRKDDLGLIRFYDLCKKIMNDNLIETNKEFVENLYNLLEHGSYMGETYRSFDFDKLAYTASHTNSVPPYAPNKSIDSLMDGLFEFLDNEPSMFLRIAIALYYVNYVKPFPKHNEEIAVLLAYATAWKDLQDAALNMPLVKLTNFNNPTIMEAFNESFATNDLSYVIDRLAYVVENDFDSFVKYIKKTKDDLNVSSEATETVINQTQVPEVEEQPIVVETPNNIVVEEEPVVEFINELVTEDVEELHEEILEVKTEIIPQETVSRIENIEPVRVEPVEEAKEQIVPEPVVNKTSEEKVVYKKVIVPVIPKTSTMSKQRIREYTKYLLERYPLLNKKQASYIANHMEPGLYYDINSFKKFNKCAYETARTSMDKLAEMGFYEKCQIKNKYVYTPTIGQNQGE